MSGDKRKWMAWAKVALSAGRTTAEHLREYASAELADNADNAVATAKGQMHHLMRQVYGSREWKSAEQVFMLCLADVEGYLAMSREATSLEDPQETRDLYHRHLVYTRDLY